VLIRQVVVGRTDDLSRRVASRRAVFFERVAQFIARDHKSTPLTRVARRAVSRGVSSQRNDVGRATTPATFD